MQEERFRLESMELAVVLMELEKMMVPLGINIYLIHLVVFQQLLKIVPTISHTLLVFAMSRR